MILCHPHENRNRNNFHKTIYFLYFEYFLNFFDYLKLFDHNNLTVTRWGTLKINYKNMMTSIDGVFAAGDIVRGASLVVWGIKDGRDAAKNINEYLENNFSDQNNINKKAVNA